MITETIELRYTAIDNPEVTDYSPEPCRTLTDVSMRSTEEQDLDSVLDMFQRFLHASGFYFDGNLEIVDRSPAILDEEEAVGPTGPVGPAGCHGSEGTGCCSAEDAAIEEAADKVEELRDALAEAEANLDALITPKE